MPLFSQRKGIRPLEKAIQRESIDVETRNRLWSCIKITVWDSYDSERPGEDGSCVVVRLCERLWHSYFKRPLDTLPKFDRVLRSSSYYVFREHFFGGEWWAVFDFIEFVLAALPAEWSKLLRSIVNDVLITENVAYRVIGSQFCDISDKNEIGAIESALNSPFAGAREHLDRSLHLLSERQNPDFRNSIKEAISAVESAAKEVSNLPKASLGECIKAMEKAGSLHPAFKECLLKLYGYTSDSGGIRHALTDGDNPPNYAEAKFMLVTCSAFLNLLVAKHAESQ